MKLSARILAVLLGLALIVIVVLALRSAASPATAPASSTPAHSSNGATLDKTSAQTGSAAGTGGEDAKSTSMVDQIGRVQPVAAGTNKQVDSVIEAQRTGTHPERLSALIAAPPFDAIAFASDPSAYIDQSVPSRAFQSAQPGKDIPVIQAVGSTQIDMKQDGEVILRVRTQPGMPATFSSFDLGRFGNSLTSQSVVADAHGIASVSFTPGPGTIAMVSILAASPVATGQVTYDINVSPASPAPAAH